MPTARKYQISLEATPYYHCISRCVRGSFLCGKGKDYNFEHRRQWIENKLLKLQSIFAIDICAYAIMSNHYHAILHIDADLAKSWSVDEIFERWHQLFKPKALVKQYLLKPTSFNPVLLEEIQAIAECYRQRLMSISWFMRIINEGIARIANKEEGCTGRFWEGRFKSQALLDEKALLACMVYNDLNPIRAKIAKFPEQSDYTSIKKRCHAYKSAQQLQQKPSDFQSKLLMPFFYGADHRSKKCIPFQLEQYLELVDWTGKQIRNDKPGFINKKYPSLLVRLDINENEWLSTSNNFEKRFKRLAGTIDKIKQHCALFGYKKIPHYPIFY